MLLSIQIAIVVFYASMAREISDAGLTRIFLIFTVVYSCIMLMSVIL